MAGREVLTRPLVTGAGREAPGWLRSTAVSVGAPCRLWTRGPRRSVSSWTSDRARSRGTSWPRRFLFRLKLASWTCNEFCWKCVSAVCFTRGFISSSCRVASEHGGKGSWAVGGVMGRMRGPPRHEAGHRLLEKRTGCFATLPHRVKGQGKNSQNQPKENKDMKIRCSTHASSA